MDELDTHYGNIFTRYPVPHLSIARCRSVPQPFEVRDISLLRTLRIRQEKTLSINADIGTDGVLRLRFSGISLKGITGVASFYQSNNLQYDLITTPWMSLGLANIQHPDIAARVNLLEADLADSLFPHLELRMNMLSAVYYENILLEKHNLILQIPLV